MTSFLGHFNRIISTPIFIGLVLVLLGNTGYNQTKYHGANSVNDTNNGLSWASMMAQDLDWAFDIGSEAYSNDDDHSNAIAQDGDGNIYVTGKFEGTADFDPSGNTALLTSNGFDDIFVAKYNSSGAYQWAFNIGGSENDRGLGIAVDASSNIYITGYFKDSNVDFNPGGGQNILSSNGSLDIFVAKYNSSGDHQWAFNIGGAGADESLGIAVDASSNVYVTGDFSGNNLDFDPGGGQNILSSNGFDDIFVAKYNSSGNHQWAFNIGGNLFDYGGGIVVDASSNVYVTGSFQNFNVDFDPGVGTNSLSSNGGHDIFVAKYNSNGVYQWASHMGGSDNDQGRGIAVDASSNIYITGYFKDSNVDFNPDGGQNILSSNGSFDIFVAKYNSSGDHQWAFNIGGSSSDEGIGIAVDPSSNVYVTGSFQNFSVDFDPSLGTNSLGSNGGHDIFVAKYNSSGAYQDAFNIGGSSTDEGRAIIADDSGKAYVTGFFGGTSVDFDPGTGTTNLGTSASGDQNFFVAAYNSSAPTSPTITANPTSISNMGNAQGSNPATHQITVNASNLTQNVIVTMPPNFEVAPYSHVGFSNSLVITTTSLNAGSVTLLVRMKSGLPIGNYSGNVTLSSAGATPVTVALSGEVIVAPSITVSTNTISGLNYAQGSGPSNESSLTVSGSDLAGDITLNAPTNFEISTSSGAGFGSTLDLSPSGGTLSNTTVYVRLKSGLPINSYSGNMTVSSTGATTENIALSGEVASSTTLVINEINFDPASGNAGDANGDGSRHATQDEFIELYNIGSSTIDLSGYTISDASAVRHTFPEGTNLSAGSFLTIFGSTIGTISGVPGTVQTSTGGSLSLNNNGDDIIIKDAVGNTVINYTYSTIGISGQSTGRSPDFTGSFVAHSSINGNDGALFSPGRNNNTPPAMGSFDGAPSFQDNTRCEGENAVLSVTFNLATSGIAHSLTWNDGTADVVSTSLSTSNNSATSGIYTANTQVTGTTVLCELAISNVTGLNGKTYTAKINAGGDITSMASGALTVNTNPNISFSSSDADNTICAGESVTFTANGGSQYEFFLNNNSVQNSISTTYVTASLSNNDKVKVTVTDGNNCSATSSEITIAVNVLPTAGLTSSDGDNTICAGESVTFTANGGSNYEFFLNNSSVQSGASATYTTATLSNNDKVKVTVTDGNNCSSTSSEIITTVNALPTAGLTSSDGDNTICAGESVTFTATGGSNYEFFVNDNSVQNSISTTYVTASLSNNDKVKVTVTDGNNCSATSSEITIAVNVLPTAGLTSSDGDNTICAGESVTFTANGGSNYEFFLNNSSVQSGASATYTTATLSNNDKVKVTVTDGNNCSSTSSEIITTVNALPTAGLTSSDGYNTICAGESVTFTATGGSNYEFFVNDNSVQNSTSATYVTTSLSNNDKVKVTVTDGNSCSATSSEITTTVNALPTATASATNATCQSGTNTANDDGKITISGFSNGATYQYSTGNAFDANNALPNAPTAIPSGGEIVSNLTNANQSYTVRITNSGGCYVDRVVSITETSCVCTAPALSDLTDETICEGASFTTSKVTTSVTNGVSVNYQWYNDNGTDNNNADVLSGQTTATLTALPTSAGTYKYRVEASRQDDASCQSSKSVTLIINALPTVTASATNATCQSGTNTANDDGKITISGFSIGATYQYSTGNTFDANNAVPNAPTAIPSGGEIVSNLTNANQSYTVRITNSGGCYVDRVVSITETSCVCTAPVLSDLTDEAICEGSSFTTSKVTTSVTNGVSVNYQWYNDNGTDNNNADVLSGQTTATLTALPTSAGIYKYRVETSRQDDASCQSSKSVTLIINALPTATASATNATCQSGTNTANDDGKITISGFSNGATYQYSTGNTFDANNALPNVPTAIPSGGEIVSNLTNANQSYTVRITNSGGCYVDRVVSITSTSCVCTAPALSDLTDETICEGASFTTSKVTTSVTNGVSVNYQWYNDNGTDNNNADVLSGQTTATLTALPTSAGTYKYRVEASRQDDASCQSSKSVTLIINALPTATASATNATCQSGTNTANDDGKITISGFSNGATYQYSTGNTFDANNAVPNVPTAIPSGGEIVSNLTNANQSYTVRITNSGGCYVDRVVSITETSCVCTAPVLSDLTDEAICEGSSFTTSKVTTSVINGVSVNYQWYNDNGTDNNNADVLSGQTTATLTALPTSAGTYKYRVEASRQDDASYQSSKSVTLIINALPTPTLTSSDNDNTICDGESVTFTAGNGGSNYEFFVNNSSVQDGTSSTYTNATLSDGDQVKVTVTDANGCSATSSEITTTVNALPTVGLTSSDNDNTICDGESVIFTASSGGSNYQFFVNDNSVQNSTSAIYTNISLSNNDKVKVMVTDGNSCSAISSEITIVVNGPITTWYRDADGDSYGDAMVTKDTCVMPIGYVANSTDCNDDPNAGGASINPGAVDIPNDGIDQDCSGGDETSQNFSILGSSVVCPLQPIEDYTLEGKSNGGTYNWILEGTGIEIVYGQNTDELSLKFLNSVINARLIAIESISNTENNRDTLLIVGAPPVICDLTNCADSSHLSSGVLLSAIVPDKFHTSRMLTSDAVIFNKDMTFRSGNSIELMSGFTVMEGRQFIAEIMPCASANNNITDANVKFLIKRIEEEIRATTSHANEEGNELIFLQKNGCLLDLDNDNICDDIDNCIDIDGDGYGIGGGCVGADCFDADPQIPANDGDCDGVATSIDCDDNDAFAGKCDADDDGIRDDMDNCPNHANADQADYDRNGVGDACDRKVYRCGTATCSDGDPCTVNDQWDEDCNCVGTYKDTDRDGVCDFYDECEGYDDSRDWDSDSTADGCDPDPACTDCERDEKGMVTICWITQNEDNMRTVKGECEYLQRFFDEEGRIRGKNQCGPCECEMIGDQDSDGDGVCDRKDECPANPELTKKTECGCELLTNTCDDDNDGIRDPDDNCPFTPNPDQSDQDDDGIGDVCDEYDCVAFSPCDDGDICTTGDRYDAECNCVGIERDDDFDGVCNELDQCHGFKDHEDEDGDGIPDGCDIQDACGSCQPDDHGFIIVCKLTVDKKDFANIRGKCKDLDFLYDEMGDFKSELYSCGQCSCEMIGDTDSDGDGICDSKEDSNR